MTAPIQPGRPDRPTAGDDPFVRRPGEDDAAYASRLRGLEAELAARQAADGPPRRAAGRPAPKPEGRQAIGTSRSGGPIGRAARAATDRRAQRDRRISAADRRAGRADTRAEDARTERRARRQERRVNRRDRRWVPDRRPVQGRRALGVPSAAVIFAVLFVLALLALVAVALF